MKHVRTLPDFGQPTPSGRRLLPIDRYRQDAASALPNEAMPGEIEPWEAVEPTRPDTVHVRALRVVELVGETLSAVAIIAGGVVLTGLATLL